MNKSFKLLVIINDKISDLVNRGEITSRYYNPGEVFNEVILLLTNNDNVDTAAVQKMIGNAKLKILNFNTPKFLILPFTLFPILQYLWFLPIIKIISTINPNLVRCYGQGSNTLLARILKRKLGIDYLVSLHINPDQDIYVRESTLIKKIYYYFYKKVEKRGLSSAKKVLPVYSTITPYLKRLNLSNFKVFYNVVNPDNLILKKSYAIKDKKIKIISVGRIFKDKYPIEVIKAVVELENVYITIIGDGPLQAQLVNETKKIDLKDRVTFIRSINNDQLSSILSEFDMFVTHSNYAEISKSLIEAMIVGLPIIINKLNTFQIREITQSQVIQVENSKDDYKKKIKEIIDNYEFRKTYGESLAKFAEDHFSPKKTESEFKNLYQSLLTL